MEYNDRKGNTKNTLEIKPEIVMTKTYFGFSFPMKSWRNPFLQRYIFTKSEGYALDFGCGARGALPELAKSYSYVVGLDMCLERPIHYSLKKAKEMTKKLRLQNVDLVLADCQNPPLREEVFVSIVCNHVLEHLMKPRKVLRSMKKMLKTGGWLYIEMPWLSELGSPNFSFNPVKQWSKVLMTKALDDIVLGKKSLLSKLFFKFDKESRTVKPRGFLPRRYYAGAWYKKFIRLEDYANDFLRGELRDPHHKHFYTKKEWIKTVESARLRILACKGIYDISIVAQNIWVDD